MNPQGVLNGFWYPSIFNNPLQQVFNDHPIENEPFLPSVNISEMAENIQLEFVVPGFKKEDFKINIEDKKITVSALHRDETKKEEKNYTRREYQFGAFKRSFILPETANTEMIEASYESGILKVNIAKKTEAKSFREVTVS